MSSGQRLKDEVAIVVGAGTSAPGLGIGQAIARLFAAEGAKVTLLDHVEDRARETQKFIEKDGGESIVVAADISDGAACEAAVAATISAFGKVSVLVNVAAFTPLLNWENTGREVFDKVMAVNVTGTFLMTQAALPSMVEHKKGSVVNIGSVSSIRSTRGHQTAYAASKSALLGLMVDLANEHGPNGIRCNTISPGMIETPLRRQTLRDRGLDPEKIPFGPQSSLGHAGDGWDIARAALFLASDEARFITGVHLPVDGGLTTRQPTG